jgi:TPP-dependent pyruvate/acetoin dehydrogenase alpha subunit
MIYSRSFLLGLYRSMLRIRLCEESLVAPILSGEVRTPCHLYSGEEAVAAGVCAALGKRDYVFGSHRSHGHYLAKGGSMRAMVAEIYCKATGCSGGRGGSMHLIAPESGVLGIAPIVAGTIPLAVGAALAASIRKDRRVAVSFFGDGASNEGVLYEAMNFAALRRLPVIFACENNLYSTHLSIRECRPNAEIFRVAAPFDIAARRVDGNDVLKVFRAAQWAVDKCRAGKGPAFLELMTYRLRGHVGPDDNVQDSHTDIRPPAEIERWRGKDPLPRLERYLIAKKVTTARSLKKIRMAVISEVEDANEFARTSPRPESSEVNRNVFKS